MNNISDVHNFNCCCLQYIQKIFIINPSLFLNCTFSKHPVALFPMGHEIQSRNGIITNSVTPAAGRSTQSAASWFLDPDHCPRYHITRARRLMIPLLVHQVAVCYLFFLCSSSRKVTKYIQELEIFYGNPIFHIMLVGWKFRFSGQN